MAKATVSVTAQKILKSGSLSRNSKSFASIKDAANWAVDQKLTDNVNNAEFNICVASRGYDRGATRKTAYGFVWSRD